MADADQSLSAPADPAAPKVSPRALRCAQCGAQFTCGRADPAGCWCAQIAPLPAAGLDPRSDCICRACLVARAISAGAPR